MKLNQFEEMTREILHTHKGVLTKAFNDAKAGANSAVLVKLDKTILSGKSTGTAYYVMSPSYNEPLYRVTPDVLKKKMYDNEHNVYVIFSGWDGNTTSYVLIKDNQPKTAA